MADLSLFEDLMSSEQVLAIKDLLETPLPSPFLYIHAPSNFGIVRQIITQAIDEYEQLCQQKGLYHYHNDSQNIPSSHSVVQNALPNWVKVDGREVTATRVAFDRILNGLANWNNFSDSSGLSSCLDLHNYLSQAALMGENWNGRLHGARVVFPNVEGSRNRSYVQWEDDDDHNMSLKGVATQRRKRLKNEAINESFDTFCNGLRDIFRIGSTNGDVVNVSLTSSNVKKDQKHRYIIIENPERLRGNWIDESGAMEGNFLSALSRLGELAGAPISVIFLSKLSWHKLQPPVSKLASPSALISVRSPSANDIKRAIARCLRDTFDVAVKDSVKTLQINNFVELIYGQVYRTFGASVSEYLDFTVRLWPCWEELSAKQKNLSNASTQFTELITHLLKNVTITEMIDVDFSVSQKSGGKKKLQRSYLGVSQNGVDAFRDSSGLEANNVQMNDIPNYVHLPQLAQWLLLSAFYCSYNPPSTDIRLFATYEDEHVTPRKKRRRNGTTSPSKKSPSKSKTVNNDEGATRTKKQKASQLVLGPKAFTLERLLAICGCLVSEERPDLETSADFGVQVATLIKLRLIVRTVKGAKLSMNLDKLEGIRLKCNVQKDFIDKVAKNLGFQLDSRLWDDEDVYER